MTDEAERHKERMARQKAIVDAGIARATERRGVIVVNTGNGKGKKLGSLRHGGTCAGAWHARRRSAIH